MLTQQAAHVVMFSSGLASYAAALRVVQAYPDQPVVLLFTDVKGANPSPHAGEDEDNYRFLQEAGDDLARIGDVRLVWLRGAEDIWDVFRRRRFLGNTRLANCSEELKQKPASEWLAEHCPDPDATTVHIGLDWTEQHRVGPIRKAYAPRNVSFPMMQAPYLAKPDMMALARARGIEPPRLYDLGMPHANCGGFCVRSGQAQFALLLRTMPERYAYHEEREQDLREYLDADVAILRDRTGGTVSPLTLRSFRERIEDAERGSLFEAFDPDEWGGCGCFTAQPRSDSGDVA
jgi:hypothetical protein